MFCRGFVGFGSGYFGEGGMFIMMGFGLLIFSREQLVNKAFGIEYDSFDRTVDTHIKNIRQKIEDDHKNPKYIISIYGMGYKFQG